MKLKYVLLLIIFNVFSIFSIKAMSPTIEYIDNVYGNRIDGTTNFSGQAGFILNGDKPIYCIEPFAWVGANYEIDNSYFNTIPEDKLKYIELVANYADEYLEYRNAFLYLAAQELIWRKLTGLDTFYWTGDKYLNGGYINLNDNMKFIEKRVNEFLIKPSFDKEIVVDDFFKTVVLEDKNNVLKYYDIINDSNNIVWKNDNKLSIMIREQERTEIKLVRKTGSGSPTYYHSETKQDLADLTSYVENIATVYVEAREEYNQEVRINFIDAKNYQFINEKVEFTLNDIDFEALNGEFKTQLNKNKYILDIKNVPDGYIVPPSFEFTIDESDLNPYKIIDILIGKPVCKLTVEIEKPYFYQLYRDNYSILNFFESDTFDIDIGTYTLVDHLNKKSYMFDIKYIDQYTSVIEKKIIIKDETKDIIKEESKVIDDTLDNIKNNKDENNNLNQIIKDNIENSYEISLNQDEIKKDNKEYCLPNTFDFLKLVKIVALALLLILMLYHVKKIFKD